MLAVLASLVGLRFNKGQKLHGYDSCCQYQNPKNPQPQTLKMTFKPQTLLTPVSIRAGEMQEEEASMLAPLSGFTSLVC